MGDRIGFYTDKASLFQTAPKIPRDSKPVPSDEREPLPPTQIGRALRELDIVWIAAHSPQAKGRVERSFQTAQDRLVKGLRVAGAKTLEEANLYLETEFLPWWNSTLVVVPASPDDAHRTLGKEHSLAASLSYVETRQVSSDYTIRFDSKIYRIARSAIRSGLRGANVRVEVRLDGLLAVRFGPDYLPVTECHPCPKVPKPGVKALQPKRKPAAPREEPVDETLPSDQPGKSGSVRTADNLSGPRLTTHSVGRAKAARPASRFLYSKPPLESLTEVGVPSKAKPSEGTPQGPVNRGLAAVYFGAISVASALNLPQDRDVPKNLSHSKPNFPNRTSKPDISTWR